MEKEKGVRVMLSGENKEIAAKIMQQIKKSNRAEDYIDLLAILKDNYDEKALSWLRKQAVLTIGKVHSNLADKYYDAYKLALLISAPHSFDCFMQFIELKRSPETRFYLPRRQQLLKIVNALQDLEDGRLQELFLSQPPRTGKSTLVLFFLCWVMGRNSERPCLYSSYSDIITTAAYNGVMEILTDSDTYDYRLVFPDAEIVRQDAKYEIIDIQRKKHYPSLTARSLYGTLNGACDAENGYIVADDLIGGIEEALNPDRLKSSWYKVDNNLIPRGKGNTRYLWIGTRWSINDPTGKRIDLLENDPKYRGYKWLSINVPALNENDESNFDYKYGVGFSTEYYHRRRASFERNNDIASWDAQYMGSPVEREGTVFEPGGMRYFSGKMPEGVEPDEIFAAVDPAYGGGDYVAMPICVQYGEDIYIPDVVFNNGDKSVTQPIIASKIESWGVQRCLMEGTKATSSYKEGVEKILKDKGVRSNITSSVKHWTGTGKEQRIFNKAPDIRERMVFVASGYRSREYEMFMQNVFSFKIEGKNKHDDAPDSLAMAMDMTEKRKKKAIIGKRPF